MPRMSVELLRHPVCPGALLGYQNEAGNFADLRGGSALHGETTCVHVLHTVAANRDCLPFARVCQWILPKIRSPAACSFPRLLAVAAHQPHAAIGLQSGSGMARDGHARLKPGKQKPCGQPPRPAQLSHGRTPTSLFGCQVKAAQWSHTCFHHASIKLASGCAWPMEPVSMVPGTAVHQWACRELCISIAHCSKLATNEPCSVRSST